MPLWLNKMSSGVGVVAALLLAILSGPVRAQASAEYNISFVPWEVMGEVNTSASGYGLLSFVGNAYNFEIYLFGITGLKSVELHVAEPGTHGDVVAVLFAPASRGDTGPAGGLVATGQVLDTDLIGPLLLPLGQHLSVEELQSRYVEDGNAAIVIHTVLYPGGEIYGQVDMSTLLTPGSAPGPSAMASSSMAMSGKMG